MTKNRQEAAPEHGFRRMIAVSKINEGGLVKTISATPAEIPSIAAYLDIAGIDALSADMTVTRWRSKGIRVQGKLKADVIQNCIVTLEPISAHIETEFERRFQPLDPRAATHDTQHEVIVDPEGEDPAEPLDREIDLGEILIEELSLSLDLYPRKPDARFEADQGDEQAGKSRKSPFATLAKLKIMPGDKG
ncbi:MAG: DUF177 domain-containing protein [Alphaproteobacteria bacterium]|nr:DUF177 domain-containing protein [Alphaproteobacteria bacterium]